MKKYLNILFWHDVTMRNFLICDSFENSFFLIFEKLTFNITYKYNMWCQQGVIKLKQPSQYLNGRWKKKKKCIYILMKAETIKIYT